MVLGFRNRVVGLEKDGSVVGRDRGWWGMVRAEVYPKLWTGRGILGCHLKQL